MIRETVTAWPLYWPTGWERTPAMDRSAYHFRKTTLFHSTQLVIDELRRLRVAMDDIVISTNLRTRPDGIPYSKQPQAQDPGVAVWFVLDKEERVLACDKWSHVEHNLRAIALHIESIRAQMRWGVGSSRQAFQGFVAIPAETTGMPWWEYFALDRDATREDVEAAYKASAKIDHPDMGGDRAAWDRLVDMRKIALQTFATKK